MALRDVLVSFSVDVTGKEQLSSVDQALTGLIDKANLLAKAFVGMAIVSGIKDFLTSTVEMGAKVVDTANKLGLGTDELQQFQYAASMVGVSGDAAAKSLQFLQRHIGLMETGTKAATKDFAALGVKIKDGAGNLLPMSEILPQVADGFEKLKDQPERVAYAVKLFGRAGAGMVPVLRSGKDGLRAYYDEFTNLGLGLKNDFLVAAKEADRGLKRLGMATDAMKSRLVLALLPAMETVMGGLMKLAQGFSWLADHTLVAQTALIALGVIAGIVFLPMLLEILPLVLAVGALYLIFDDLFTLFAGGQSVTGDLIDSLFGEGSHESFVKEVKQDAKDLWEDFKNLLPTLHEVGTALKGAFEESAPAMKWVLNLLADVGRSVVALFKAMMRLKDGDFSGAADVLNNAGRAMFGDKEAERQQEQGTADANREYFRKFKEDVDRKNNPKLAASMPGGGGYGPNGQPGLAGLGGGGADFNMHGDINIIVSGADDPHTVTKNIAQGIVNESTEAYLNRQAQAATQARGSRTPPKSTKNKPYTGAP